MDYFVDESDNPPEGLMKAVDEGKKISVHTCIGWIALDRKELIKPSILNTYRVEE